MPYDGLCDSVTACCVDLVDQAVDSCSTLCYDFADFADVTYTPRALVRREPKSLLVKVMGGIGRRNNVVFFNHTRCGDSSAVEYRLAKAFEGFLASC